MFAKALLYFLSNLLNSSEPIWNIILLALFALSIELTRLTVFIFLYDSLLLES